MQICLFLGVEEGMGLGWRAVENKNQHKITTTVSRRWGNGNEGEEYIAKEPDSVFIAFYFFLFYCVLFPRVYQKGDVFAENEKELSMTVSNIIAEYLNRVEEK